MDSNAPISDADPQAPMSPADVRRLYDDLIEQHRELGIAYETQRDMGSLFRALFQTLPAPVCVADPVKLTIEYANDELAALAGYPVEAVVGEPVDRLGTDGPDIGQQSATWLSELCVSLSKPGDAASAEGTLLCADGVRVPVAASGRRFSYQDRVLLAISITDLRGQNEFGAGRLEQGRAEMLRETAIAVASKVNDPLFVILSDVVALQGALASADPAILSRLGRVLEAAQRIQRVTAQLSAITAPVAKEYLPGVRMLDLDESVGASVERSKDSDD